MYGLDPSTDIGFLIGRRLDRLRVGLFQLSLEFDEDVSISVESEIRVLGGSEESTIDVRSGRYLADVGSLQPFLDRSVVAASVEPRGVLRLRFEDDLAFELVEDADSYECYQIRYKAVLIIV